MEKLNELVYRAEGYLLTKAESQPEQINVSCKTILAIAAAFRALEHRAEAAEAKLAKQEPVAWLVLNSSEGYVERNPDVVAFLEAAGLTKCKPLFTRPAPVADLAELVEEETTLTAGVNALVDCLEDCGDAEQGLRLALRAILRNIEEAK